MAGKGGGSIGWIRGVIAIILIQIVVLFLYDTQGYVTKLIQSERNMNTFIVGKQSEAVIKERANIFFTETLIDTGLYGAGNKWAAETARVNRADLESHTRGWLRQRLDAVWMFLWLMSYRLIGISVWLILAIPLAVALIVDAFIYREIRKWRYQMSSPFNQNMHEKMSHWLFGIVVYLPFAPFPMPSWITPIAIMAVMIMLRGAIANLQKRI